MMIVHWGKYYYPDVGGIESVTRSLAVGAADAGYDVTVICFRKSRKKSQPTRDGRVRIVRARMGLSIKSQPLSFGYLAALLRTVGRADVIQVHVPNMLAAFVACFVPRRVQVIVHWHSDVVSKGMLGRLVKPVEQRMLARADCIVATSKRYAEASICLRPHLSKVSVVPIGVPDLGPAFARNPGKLPGDLERWIGDAPVPLIVSTGRLVSYKGFDVLIEAARYIRLAKIVIVGKGPLELVLKERVKSLGLDGRVYLAGFLLESELDALMRQASLFCLASVERSEAFGVVLAEAMSYGLPIISTEISGSGVPWVNEHGLSGFNVPVGDPTALADACNAVLDNDGLRRLLAAGSRRRFDEEFEEAKSVRRMVAIYRQLCGDVLAV